MMEIIIAIFVAVASGFILKHLDLIPYQRLLTNMKIKNIRKKESGNIVFISAGGTCRDPMAAAITANLFHNEKIKSVPIIHSRALGPVSKSEVSFAARKAIKELVGEDLLKDHVPKTLSKEDCEKADVLLVMDKSLLNRKALPQDKTYILKEFFGQEGDIADPWPDGRDEETLKRYLETARELQNVIKPGFKKLVNIIQ